MPGSRHRFCDEFGDDLDGGLGWIVDGGPAPRTSHALAAGGGVWLVDAVDFPGLDERIAELGEPRGVIQLLDRHKRDCAPIARRLGVPHYRLPVAGVPGAPFEVIGVVRIPTWRELALWWPSERTLVTGDALGTLPYFCEPGAQLGIHPFLRLTPPRKLADLEPFRVLCGHGEGVHGGDVADELRAVLARSRRGLPAAFVQGWRWVKSRD